ncbi:MAG: amino acid ABC transporter permease [Pseudomonadota bacterium]
MKGDAVIPAPREAAASSRPGSKQSRYKLGWLDFAILAVLGIVLAVLAYRVNTVLVYKWDWSIIPRFLYRFDDEEQRWIANLLMQGFWTTVRLTLWGSVLAAVIGLAVGLCRISHDLFLRMISRAYVELIRNIPPLVFIFIFYFFLSSQLIPLLGIDQLVRNASPETRAVIELLFGDPKLLPQFVSGLVCLAMFEAAYVAEIVRAGIQSIPKGQWEAGESLGLSRFDQMRDVILPQAVQRTLPPLTSQFISLIKDSSIVSLISIQELTFMASQVVVSTQRVFEVWITVAAMYFGLCFVFSWVFGRLERRMGRAQR